MKPTLREFISMENYSPYLIDMENKDKDKGIFALPTVPATVDSILLPFRLKSADHVDILGNDNTIIDILHIIGQYSITAEDLRSVKLSYEYRRWAYAKSFHKEHHEHEQADKEQEQEQQRRFELYLSQTPAYPALFDIIPLCDAIANGGGDMVNIPAIADQPPECLTDDGHVILFNRVKSTAPYSSRWINRIRDLSQKIDGMNKRALP